jgi:hypothetical protein
MSASTATYSTVYDFLRLPFEFVVRGQLVGAKFALFDGEKLYMSPAMISLLAVPKIERVVTARKIPVITIRSFREQWRAAF